MFDSGENISPEPSVNEYRFKVEKARRLRKGESVDTLLSQETSFVSDDLVIANLKLLRKDGTFFPEERCWDGVEDVSYRNFVKSEIFDLENTDWMQISQKVSEFILAKPDVVASLNIGDLEDLDPAVATTLAFEITKHYIKYDEKLVDLRAIDKPQEIIDKGSGTCEHFTKVSVAIYEHFKRTNKSNSLKNTTLIPVGNSLLDDLSGHHSYCLLVAKRSETVLSIGDPTFYAEAGYEVQSDIRLASLVETLVSEHMLEKLGIKKDTVLGFVNEQLSRIENRVNYSNIGDINKQDERVAHLFLETTSFLQIIYALNSAKALLEDEQLLFSQGHFSAGALATKRFLDIHREDIGHKAYLESLNKILKIDHGGGIDLLLLKEICNSFLSSKLEASTETIDNFTKIANQALNRLQNENIFVSNLTDESPWAEPKKELKYNESEISEVNNLISQLS